jgi:hypothetical protein
MSSDINREDIVDFFVRNYMTLDYTN